MSVIWITGLSGAGKSTLAREVVGRLKSEGNFVINLDGDDLREIFGLVDGVAVNYRREDRIVLALRYAHLCNLLARQGCVVVIATISLFREVHAWNRVHLPNYFEVYLKCPFEELRRRDPKGIYRRFDEGSMINVAGLDLAIDEPEAPDWVVEYDPTRSLDELSSNLLTRFNERKAL